MVILSLDLHNLNEMVPRLCEGAQATAAIQNGEWDNALIYTAPSLDCRASLAKTGQYLVYKITI